MSIERLEQLYSLGDLSVYQDLSRELIRAGRLDQLKELNISLSMALFETSHELPRMYRDRRFKEVKEKLNLLKEVSDYTSFTYLIQTIYKLFSFYVKEEIYKILEIHFGKMEDYETVHLLVLSKDGEYVVNGESHNRLVCDFRIDSTRIFHQFKIYHRIFPYNTDPPLFDSTFNLDIDVPIERTHFGVFAFNELNGSEQTNIYNSELLDNLLEYLSGSVKLSEALSDLNKFFEDSKKSLKLYESYEFPYLQAVKAREKRALENHYNQKTMRKKFMRSLNRKLKEQ